MQPGWGASLLQICGREMRKSASLPGVTEPLLDLLRIPLAGVDRLAGLEHALRMVRHLVVPRLAAAQLVVHHDGAARLGDAVEKLEVVVRGAGTAVKKDERRLGRVEASHDAVVGAKAQVGQVSLSDVHVTPSDDASTVLQSFPKRR